VRNCEHRADFTAEQIADACGGALCRGSGGTRAQGVSTDTRTLRCGEAFFALRGPNHDGHDYLPEAVADGAPILVVDHWSPQDPPAVGASVVEVQDTTEALLALAAWHRRRLSGTLIAVTGSYGKSTVKGMVGAVLGRAGRCTVAPASFNNRIGVARTLLAAGRSDDFVVLEMGTNHPGEVDELARAGRPHVGVITAIGEVHLEGLGSLAGVREAKAELIPWLSPDGALILNADDLYCSPLRDCFAGRVLTFGNVPRADVRPTRVRRSGTGWAFDALDCSFHLTAGARYNVMNAAAALCAALAVGVTPERARQPLAAFRPPALRYEVRTIGGIRFVLDCYNSNPPAMRAALRSFLAEDAPGRKVVVCGDMLELGAEAPALHRQVGRELADAPIDAVVGVGKLSRHAIEGWHSRALPPRWALWFADAEEACEPLGQRLRPGDAVLLKGSRAMRLETIADRMAEQQPGAGREAA
jgi:UDP-N-acetylmuramoyl-tripeptide--D-alanyl-D-alanine ligase